MLETAIIPKNLKQFYIIPLDKPGKDPTSCGGKRPIALLPSLMKMLELIIVRRILPIVSDIMSEDQYAYQRARSTEILLADLDHFVTTSRNKNKTVYLMGLDIAGAFDSAAHQKIIDSLEYFAVPVELQRFIGIWLTQRNFRMRLATPIGTVYSKRKGPTKGVPQGGVLSPLLWLLHIDRLSQLIKTEMIKAVPYKPSTWPLMIQIFADDAKERSSTGNHLDDEKGCSK